MYFINFYRYVSYTSVILQSAIEYVALLIDYAVFASAIDLNRDVLVLLSNVLQYAFAFAIECTTL